MKRFTKKMLHAFLFGSIMFGISCQNNIAYDLPEEPERQLGLNIESLSGIEREIAVNILTSRFGGYKKGELPTRAASEFSLTPYIIEGDTVYYVAQYTNGWELYSTNHSMPMVLFSSEEGNFESDYASFPDGLKFMIGENGKAIQKMNEAEESGNQTSSEAHSSWGGFSVTEEEFADGHITALTENGERTTISAPSLPPGQWILIESEELGTDSYTSPKLTTTKWGQDYPWNVYAKWVADGNGGLIQAQAGCAAVSVAQFLYVTHYKDGIPEYTPETAIRRGNDYNFFGNSSDNWDKMAMRSLDLGTNEVALLLGAVGRQINMDYKASGSESTNADIARYLIKVYDKYYRVLDYNYIIVQSLIDQGYPVIASANSNRNQDGTTKTDITRHSMLIDQYRCNILTWRYLYAYKRDPLPPGTADIWLHDLVDANGNIIKYAYTNEVITESINSFQISMNWGYNGAYNNIFSPRYDIWICGRDIYNLDHKIVVADW